MKGFGDVILITIKFAELLLRIIVLGGYIKHSKEYFSRYPNPSSLLQNSAAPRVFNSLSSVWISNEILIYY